MNNKPIKFIFDKVRGLHVLIDAENAWKLEQDHIIIKYKKAKNNNNNKCLRYYAYDKNKKNEIPLAEYLFGEDQYWARKVTNHKFTRSNMKSRPKARTARRKWIHFDRFNNEYRFTIKKNGKIYKGCGYRTESEAIRAFNKCMELHGFPERLDLEINKDNKNK